MDDAEDAAFEAAEMADWENDQRQRCEDERDAAFAEVERLHGIVVHDTIEIRRLTEIVDLCCAEHEAWKTQSDSPAGPVWTAKGAFSAWLAATHARVEAVAAEVARRG